jgi:hypothetical protein
MTSNKEDIANYPETIFFIVFFFLLASVFSDKSDFQTSYTLPYSLQNELETGYHSDPPGAVIVDGSQIPPVLKSCVDILYGSNLNFYNQYYRISGDNRKISQSIKIFQKTRLEIEPLPVWRFYFHTASTDTEDLPVLS